VATEIYGVWNDQQIPYHDPAAHSVAVQIFAAAKLKKLILNGDWGDYQGIGTHAQGDRTDLYVGIRQEVKEQQRLLKEAVTAIKPKEVVWNDGNHEWRVQRAFQKDVRLAAKVLDIEFPATQITSVREATSIPALMGFSSLNIKYTGGYPKGCWLKEGLEPERNVYVQHGYTARKKGGYTVSGQMEDHWSSMIVGHCERLAGPIWNRKLGRDYFGIENGNTSLIGEPDKGDGIYAGVPHSDPKLLNHRQGITVCYWDSGQWWPYCIKIRDGKAYWNGKLYRG
jgi:hypothetical protein